MTPKMEPKCHQNCFKTWSEAVWEGSQSLPKNCVNKYSKNDGHGCSTGVPEGCQKRPQIEQFKVFKKGAEKGLGVGGLSGGSGTLKNLIFQGF